MDETAAVADALGMYDAINLDGGGSTAGGRRRHPRRPPKRPRTRREWRPRLRPLTPDPPRPPTAEAGRRRRCWAKCTGAPAQRPMWPGSE
ncbi:MAG: phosphodiester glycosidase family protein [Kribbellaceae bacterium]